MTVKSSGSKKTITKKSVKTASIYLAHPIASANLHSASWKDDFIDAFDSAGLDLLLVDPSRNGFVDGKHDELIVAKNKNQIAQARAVVAYASTPSAGTSMEILYAFMLHIPVFTYCNSRIPAWVMMHSTKVHGDIGNIIKELKRLVP